LGARDLKGWQIVRLHKSIHPMLRRIAVIDLVIIITWFVAFSGWKQALKLANDTGILLFPLAILIDPDFFYRPINIPCFLSTFLVSPLPYCIYILFQAHWRKYPVPHQNAFIDRLTIYILILATLIPLLGWGFGLFIGAAGGGLDIMLSEQINLLWMAVIYGSPITIPLTVITLVFFVIIQGARYAYWWLLPASVSIGMAVFRLMFLLIFLLVGVPPA